MDSVQPVTTMKAANGKMTQKAICGKNADIRGLQSVCVRTERNVQLDNVELEICRAHGGSR